MTPIVNFKDLKEILQVPDLSIRDTIETSISISDIKVILEDGKEDNNSDCNKDEVITLY